MDKLEAMMAFTKVVGLGSYAQAARALGSTRSSVSKVVMELEQLLGVRLLDRTTRRLAPTEVGRAYYERCLDILARVEETEIQVSRLHAAPTGTLRVNAPVSFGILFLAPAISEFMTRFPAVKVELTLSDRFINPIEEGVDLTIRISELTDSSLIARKLAPMKRVIVASPGYLASRQSPGTPEDLANHDCLTYGHTTALQRWSLLRDGALVAVPVNSVLCCNNGDVLRMAALSGRGLAQLPTFLIEQDIHSARLITVLDDFAAPDLVVHALYAPNRYLAAKTRMFVDFLVEQFAGPPLQRA